MLYKSWSKGWGWGQARSTPTTRQEEEFKLSLPHSIWTLIRLLSLNIKKGQWLFFWGPWLYLFFQFKYYALTEILPPRNNCQLLILAFHRPNHKPLLNLVTSARILAPKAVTHLQFVGIWVLMYLRKSQQGVALWEGGSFFWSLQYSVSLNGSQTIRNLPPLIEYFPEMTLASLY